MKSYLFSLVLILSSLQLFCQKQSTALPKWVFDLAFYSSNQYTVGISDPDMDSVSAFEQAKLRALINYGIFNDSKYSSLTSIAIGNQQVNSNNATGIETILYTSIIKGDIEMSDSIQIEKKEFTQYNECCVLVKKVPFKNTNTGIFNYSIVRKTGFQKENNMFPVFIDEIELNAKLNDSVKMTYLINRERDTFQIKSKFGTDNTLNKILFKNTYRNYSSAAGADNETDASFYTSFSSGLWAAFLFELSDQISFNSILNKNKANQLITLEQGNISKKNEIKSVNNFILSSKKLETEPLNKSIESINLQANYLKIKLKQTTELAHNNYQNVNLNKSSRRKLRKLQKKNWMAIGFSDIKQAYSSSKSYELNDKFISASTSLETQNLGNGILKGLQIARTEIENQLKSRLKVLNQLNLGNNNDLSVKTSKSLIGENTYIIEPYFIFFRKISRNYYQLEIMLFYKTN